MFVIYYRAVGVLYVVPWMWVLSDTNIVHTLSQWLAFSFSYQYFLEEQKLILIKSRYQFLSLIFNMSFMSDFRKGIWQLDFCPSCTAYSYRNTGHYKNYKSGKLHWRTPKSFTGNNTKKKKKKRYIYFNVYLKRYICKNFSFSQISSSARKR